MPDANLLFIHALTSVHPGGGAALGVVDLPVQRERHTRWPMIAGSGLKGVLRDACRKPMGDGGEWLAAFGPETADASDHAGALAFTDARLLAFPVRSLRGVFAWVTCPAVLDRFGRDARLLAGSTTAPPPPPAVDRGRAACPKKSDNLVDGGRLLLEEFEFRRADDGNVGAIAEWLASRAVGDEATAARVERNLVVLHDDDFTHFARHATEVVARVGLDYANKTVRRGALFYEEFLPPETLLYAAVLATDSRRGSRTDGQGKELRAAVDLDAAGMLGLLKRHAPPLLQIGADQTIGKGLCGIRILAPEGGDA